ncbi:MAG: carbohydrate kinase [Armatimonadetes bacterium]|nr:carbohydrate kinase [Armatimonadota bacterium]
MGSITVGLDIGTSSVKGVLRDNDLGVVLAEAQSPADRELPIDSPLQGWAEQDPWMWWDHTLNVLALLKTLAPDAFAAVSGIGIAYQMHGLCLLDEDLSPVRPAIIWCDSRAVGSGEKMAQELGTEHCTKHLGTLPGNFTAAKLRWVADHESEVLRNAKHAVLPGDFVAAQLTGLAQTSETGLSEMALWDFANSDLDHLAWERTLAPVTLKPQHQNCFASTPISPELAEEMGLPKGCTVCYRAGDQPNNALAMGALAPGDVAATAGTSGVLYQISNGLAPTIPSGYNQFLHVNGLVGLLLCINGTGSAYRWIRELVGDSISNEELNGLAVSGNSNGVRFYPWGNGAERLLNNRNPGASLVGLDFARHSKADVVRAVVEGIIFAFKLGQEQMGAVGRIRAGNANMFKSELFCKLVASTLGATVDLIESSGAVGAAIGAAYGTDQSRSLEEYCGTLEITKTFTPEMSLAREMEAHYVHWKSGLP